MQVAKRDDIQIYNVFEQDEVYKKNHRVDLLRRKDVEQLLQGRKIHQHNLETQNHQLKSSVRQLEVSKNCYQNMYQYAPIAYMAIDKKGIIRDKNIKAFEMFGYGLSEVEYMEHFVYPNDRALFCAHISSVFKSSIDESCEIRLIAEGGKIQYAKLYSSVLIDSTEQCLIAIIDINETKKKEESICRMAFFDTLTGLPNRTLLHDRINQALKSSHRFGEKFALLFIDLDNFKKVNDTYGHETGDKVLKEVSQKMQSSIREIDVLSRIGGDEFTLLLQKIQDLKEVEIIAQRILNSVNSIQMYYSDLSLFSASIGISIYPDDGTTAEEILRNADRAMYTSKHCSKNTYCFFNKQ